MTLKNDASDATAPPASNKVQRPRFEAKILCLVRGASERRAIELGEVDAILDAETGRAILLPDAQAAMLNLKQHFRSLVNLASDGYWEQDALHRFVACSGIAISAEGKGGTLGRTLWELDFEQQSPSDWQTHRTQLAWRAVFRDLELCQLDSSGELRYISLSGEPVFDAEDRFTGYRGITRDITQRKNAESRTAQGADFERAVIEAMATPVCLLDAQARIQMTNSTWRQLAESQADGDPGYSDGDAYLVARVPGDDINDGNVVAMAAGIAQVLSGEREIYRFEHAIGAAARPRWFSVTATRLRHAGVARVMLAHEDLSEHKGAVRWLELESAVAAGLADADNATTALSAVLRAICVAQQWDCGQYFELDSAASTLAHLVEWGTAETQVEEFLGKACNSTVRADSGLAGRVCQARQPLWILDATRDARMAVALPHETGMRGTFMFPVVADGVTHGILAFASRAVLDVPNERCLQTVANIGRLLARFLRRCAQQAQQRQSEARYKRYTALACDWHWETDRDLCFIATTETGIAGVSDILGKKLWELPHLQVSDDEWTKLRAELAAQWSFCDFACTAILADGREARYCLSGEPAFDDHGAFSGFLGVGLDITRRPQ